MLHAAHLVERSSADHTAPIVPLNEIALTGIFEISKILTAPTRLETTLANVVNLLQSFLQMRHGVVALLSDDGIPDLAVGAGWSEGSDERYRGRLPQKAVDQIVATAMPLVAENIATHPAFSQTDVETLGASETTRVSFIGVPIRIDSKVVGTLTIDRVWDERPLYRLDSDVRLLTMIANLVGQTVKLHRIVAQDRERLMHESYRLQKELSELKPTRDRRKVQVEGIIGDSPALRGLLEKIAVVAKSNSTVLLRGESGTGKELIAKAIHELSPRAKRPFIKINCAALPESVLESELFGHEKGAFTGALNSRKGRFELADKGTLFLDEIGEISASFQAKLLRVLQEQEFERVGGNQTIKVDVRVIAATNRNLEEAVARSWKVAQTLIEIWSGVASEIRAIVDAARAVAPHIPVACTRKNVPGTKRFAVAAVKAGGAVMHRLGLSETVLVFPEHRAFLGELQLFQAVERLRRAAPEKKLLIEVKTADAALAAAVAGFDVIQVEKFSPVEVAALIKRMASMAYARERPVIAAAGGVNAANVAAYAEAGADVLVTSAPYLAKPRDVQVRITAAEER